MRWHHVVGCVHLILRARAQVWQENVGRVLRACVGTWTAGLERVYALVARNTSGLPHESQLVYHYSCNLCTTEVAIG